jgi:hypothetical protein
MNRRWVLLNVALIALAAMLGWLLRQHWLEAQAHERAIFDKAARARNVLPPPPITPPGSVSPATYLDVASRMLFASDRNPNVIVEPPKPAPPPPPMPALPAYFGQMAIGQPTVVLSSASNMAQKSYHAGEKIGPFEIVSFDHEKIAFKWEDKTVEKKLSDLMVKDAPPAPVEQDPTKFPPQSQPLQARPAQAQSLGGTSSDIGNKPDATLGVDMVDGKRGCVNGDTSPAGTVVNGMKKMMPRTLMGFSCYWEPVAK